MQRTASLFRRGASLPERIPPDPPRYSRFKRRRRCLINGADLGDPDFKPLAAAAAAAAASALRPCRHAREQARQKIKINCLSRVFVCAGFFTQNRVLCVWQTELAALFVVGFFFYNPTEFKH